MKLNDRVTRKRKRKAWWRFVSCKAKRGNPTRKVCAYVLCLTIKLPFTTTQDPKSNVYKYLYLFENTFNVILK